MKYKKIICNNKDIFLTMDDFFKKLPAQYGYNYYKNFSDLGMKYVSNLGNGCTGLYDPDINYMWYSTNESIPHELFHMAANDFDKGKLGFYTGKVSAIDEGIAEYLANRIFNLANSKYYPFESLCASMLLDYPGVLKAYFQANNDELYKQFNDDDTLEALIEEMNYYNRVSGYLMNMIYMDGENARFDEKALIDIKGTAYGIICYLIRLGQENKDKINMNKYLAKLMNGFSNSDISNFFNKFYPEYIDDTKEEIRKLMR